MEERHDEGDTLTVSGGGSTLVATDVLLAQAALVRQLHADSEAWQARLVRIRRLDPTPAPGWTTADSGPIVFAAYRSIADVERSSGELAGALVAAADGYGYAERTVEIFARASGALAGYSLGFVLGRLAPLLALAAIPVLAAGATAWLLAGLGAGTKPGATATRTADTDWLRVNPRLLTSPAFVAIVRVLVSSVDDAAAGVFAVPFPVSMTLGDEGLGLLGVTSSAAGALTLARPLGLLRESPVSVGRIGRARAADPPAGLEDLAARIPQISTGGPQVRVERYGEPQDPAWAVYIGGTAEWAPITAEDPWDLTSNVSAVADQGAGSYRAVLQVMREAGIRPGDPVIAVGHSQGGLVAEQIAASGEVNSVALATFGAPLAPSSVPENLPTVSVEHADDLVPALGGAAGAAGMAGAGRLVVRREVYATAEVPAAQALPAHTLTNYRETGRLIDGSPEPRLREFRKRLATVLGTAPGDATLWRGTRVRARAGTTAEE